MEHTQSEVDQRNVSIVVQNIRGFDIARLIVLFQQKIQMHVALMVNERECFVEMIHDIFDFSLYLWMNATRLNIQKKMNIIHLREQYRG